MIYNAWISWSNDEGPDTEFDVIIDAQSRKAALRVALERIPEDSYFVRIDIQRHKE